MIKRLISVLIIFSMIVSLSADFSALDEKEILISVSVVGAVEDAGVYRVPAGSRLSEVFFYLKEIQLQREEKEFQIDDIEMIDDDSKLEYSLRNVCHIRDGAEKKIDLQSYFILGNSQANPVMKDGDIIRLSAAEYDLEIFGAVNNPAKFDFCEGDRVSNLIDLALGLKASARTDEAVIVRLDKDTGKTSELEFSPQEAIQNRDSEDDISLMSGDRVFIRAKLHANSQFNVEVAGLAKYNGKFAIEEGKTRLSDILKKCGGAREEASIDKAYLQRLSTRDTTVVFDPEFKRLMELNIPEMSQVEYEYQKFKMRELEGKLNVDFRALWENQENAFDPILEDGDYIYFPRRVTTVQVSGAVMNPGAYSYVPGKNFEYYISEAGGFSNNASKYKLRIIKDETDSWLKRDKNIIISEGDMIFVPEKPELDYIQITKDVFTMLAQLATVILAVNNLNSN